MTAAPTKPLTASVFFESGLARGVKEISILHAEYQHERAVVTVEKDAATSKRFATGAPVSIVWGFAPTYLTTFYGYANHIAPIHKPTELRDEGGALMRVVCVAPTWVFKDTDYLTFRNLSAPQAVKKVAERFRFGLTNIQPQAVAWPVLHQQGRSYWDFMVECAQKAGWTLFGRGMDLHCLDRKQSVASDAGRVPTLRSRELGGSVIEFRPQHGSNTPAGGTLAVREAYGVNPKTGQLLYSRDGADSERPMYNAAPQTPTFHQGMTDVVYEGLGEGYGKLQAGARANRLSIEATMLCEAHPHVRVGSSINLKGFGAGNDGAWFVVGTEVRLKPALDTLMSVRLGRDTSNSAAFVVPPVTQVAGRPRHARLVNRKWVLG